MRVGTSELVVIFIVALLVLGPEKVPKYAKQAGKFLGSIKVYADKLSEEINESVVEPLDEIQEPLKDAIEPLANISNDINKPIKEIKQSVNDIGKPKKKDVVPSSSDEDNKTYESSQETQETQETQEKEEKEETQEA